MSNRGSWLPREMNLCGPAMTYAKCRKQRVTTTVFSRPASSTKSGTRSLRITKRDRARALHVLEVSFDDSAFKLGNFSKLETNTYSVFNLITCFNLGLPCSEIVFFFNCVFDFTHGDNFRIMNFTIDFDHDGA
jgi:hypothetical protein